jgi:hypothetical protein
MRTAQQIADEATQTLERLAKEAAAAGHPALAGFLNKQSSVTHWSAPALDHSKPNAEEAEWHPELRAPESTEELQPA